MQRMDFCVDMPYNKDINNGVSMLLQSPDTNYDKLGDKLYGEINGTWEAEFPLRTITMPEARVLGRRILKKFWPKEVPAVYQPSYVRRPRRAWASTKATANDRRHGIRDMVHDIGHAINDDGSAGKKKTHWHGHAALELEIARWVIRKGLHKAKPVKPAMPRPSPAAARSAKLDATRASIKRWETKAKRAATALRKLRARERGLSRALNAGHVQTAGKVIHMPLI
jgi:hypothetical protein